MPQAPFGRTNLEVPPIWLRLATPLEEGPEAREALVQAALATGAPLDITTGPALWGGAMRGTDAFLTAVGKADYERAKDDAHAADLIGANLLQILSALGREHVDIYFLRVRRMVEEYQIAGALEALEAARQDGHVRFVGLCCDGPGLAALGVWQFHDAFEALLVPRNHMDDQSYRTLAPLAKERRVGVVTSDPLNWGYGLPFTALPGPWRLRNLSQGFYGLSLEQAVLNDLSREHPVLAEVRSPDDVRKAVEAPSKQLPEGLNAYLEPFREAWQRDEEWTELIQSPDPLIQAAAERRMRR